MRRIRLFSLAATAALAFGTGGCLDSLIPAHSAAVHDAGAPSGGRQDSPAPTSGGGSSSTDPDGGTAGSVDAAAPPSGITPDPGCINKAAATIDGHHNAGQACLNCHDGNTAGANKFYAGGTVYDALTGGNALTGVTIEIIDAKGVKVDIVTAQTGAPGNFWTATPLTYPVQVRASQCPFDRPMGTPAATGNCSSAGCHVAGNQVHMP